jgi:cytochrome c
MHRPILSSFVLVASAALFGCGGAPSPEPAAPSASSAPSTAQANDDGKLQAMRGAKLYAENCASCHGANGEGTRAPAVVGEDALPLDPRPEQKYRKVQFHTALDVAQFVAKNMPPKNPGSLEESDYWDILAFDLEANGVPVAGKHIDSTTAAEIKLH